MTKIYFKLIAMALALLLSVSVLIMSSYAWMVLSSSPAVTGIKVIIGGGNTILVAPDTAEEINGEIYHYPGYFSDKLNFGTYQNYDYLKELGGLTPVSTTNGIDWFLPAYYSAGDPEVQSGKVLSGVMKDVSEFKADSELSHANLSSEEKDKIKEGNYIYLDFWVVSPGGDYTLRVSTGDEDANGGSFVTDLPEAKKTADVYTLSIPEGKASAAVRIGFLANDSQLTDDTMLEYQQSGYADDRYTALKGIYMEPDSGTAYLDSDHFTVYEPNGDLHPLNPKLAGSYVQTNPLGYENGIITENKNFSDHLTVQLSGSWAAADSGEETILEQKFQTALISWEDLEDDDITEEVITERFYKNNLQGQISPFYIKGDFIGDSRNLSAIMSEDELERLFNAGATENVYIVKLEQNKPQRIRMFIWLEGQDIDCIDGIDASRIAVNIEFAGGSE